MEKVGELCPRQRGGWLPPRGGWLPPRARAFHKDAYQEGCSASSQADKKKKTTQKNPFSAFVRTQMLGNGKLDQRLFWKGSLHLLCARRKPLASVLLQPRGFGEQGEGQSRARAERCPCEVAAAARGAAWERLG